jgi:Circadian oscillating protein COP23
MNKQLTILVTGLLAAQAVMLVPARSQEQEQTPSEVKFYCGTSYDRVGRKDVPTTLASIPNREKPSAVIIWKSEYFGKEYTPQKRCDLVSPKFQAAYMAGKLEHLVTGTIKGTKEQIVCGVANLDESCNSKASMLFTLKPFSNDTSALKYLVSSEGTSPITQSARQSSTKPKSVYRAGNREVLDLGTRLRAK